MHAHHMKYVLFDISSGSRCYEVMNESLFPKFRLDVQLISLGMSITYLILQIRLTV